MKTLLSLTFLIFSFNGLSEDLKDSFEFHKERNKVYLNTSTSGNSFNIKSEDTDTSSEADADFSVFAQDISAQYFFKENLALSFSYYFALVIDIDAELQGFELGAEYFPLNSGATKSLTIGNISVESRPEFAPYLYFAAMTRDVQFSTVNLKFQGIGASVGSYWHLNDDFYLKGSVRYEYLQNNNTRELTGIGGTIGVGKSF